MRDGYILETYSGDHRRYHVHIYRSEEFIGRFDIEKQTSLNGDLSNQVLKCLEELRIQEIFERITNGKSSNIKNSPTFNGAEAWTKDSRRAGSWPWRCG